MLRKPLLDNVNYKWLFVFFNFSVAQQQVKPVLDKLKADSDIDVQYYALEAIDGNYYLMIV